ncbi:FAD-dependent oxidoreductase domain-containing protein 2-like [Ylistrum balloti]|uniref:FAD-dependent oxidoreductase domain-containing protein 2-like n=1 Tax=Ylistrum balloti TaxID=509963 RepID=UPI002905F09D|nr:FAD-dependent oxidoreductase domain-containing protein 2-like [Ylistrum balloti]
MALFHLIILTVFIRNLSIATERHTRNYDTEFCIIGAGPAGLQLGYFFERSRMDYLIYERSNISGSFFVKYPRHGRLISINKRNTGSSNKEFNLRHDWNSLLSDDDRMLFRHYSSDLFPHKDTMIRYLNDYSKHFRLKVKYNTEISNIRTTMTIDNGNHPVFRMDDQNGKTSTCKVVILATGLFKPYVPDLLGVELTDSYDTLSVDPEDYEAKSVMILGRGNSAFETADAIYSKTNFIHMVGRSRIRLAWETHYVGDIRAVNNGLLDTYQLKSLDGLMEFGNVTAFRVVSEGGKLFLRDRENSTAGHPFDNDPLNTPYDKIIRCLGFMFDKSIFNNESWVPSWQGRMAKYPKIRQDYQSPVMRGLFFAGTMAHSLDYRKSAGGFIHGFRYTARALFNILRHKYKKKSWPNVRLPLTDLSTTILKRVNEASGLYQMFSVLGDIVLINREEETFRYIEEFPLRILHHLEYVTGIDIGKASVLVVVLQYGHDFHGPQEDVFRVDRASTDPIYAELSNFLHPVLYYYDIIPNQEAMASVRRPEFLPVPDEIHHVLEDFTTQWNRPQSHVEPLHIFLEEFLKIPSQIGISHQECVLVSLTMYKSPMNCRHFLDRHSVI